MEKVKKRNNFKSHHSKKMIQWWSMLALPLLHVFIFCYLPMAGVIIAFKDYKYSKGIFGSPWAGLKHFSIFWESKDIWKVVYNTIYLNVLFLILGTVAALALAVLFFELKSRKALKVYHTSMITPNFVSWVIGGYIVYALLSPETGAINGMLRSLGFSGVNWYGEPQLWPGILSIMGIWKNVGMKSIIYYAALMGVDPTLFEAAEIDGAGKWHKVKNIMIPAIMPVICMTLILSIGGILSGDFGMFYQLTRGVGELRKTTEILPTYTFRLFKEDNSLSLSTAVSLAQSVAGMALTLLTNKIIKIFDSDSSLF